MLHPCIWYSITVVSRVSAHGCSTISHWFRYTGRLPGVLGAYPVYWALAMCKNWNRWSQYCGRGSKLISALYRAHARAFLSSLDYWQKYQFNLHKLSELVIWIREGIEIVDIVFANILLIGSLVASSWWALAILILAQLTWALTREWALTTRLGKTVIWALTREWALARDTMVLENLLGIFYLITFICFFYCYMYSQ
jgi:hypothetical protein